MHLNVMKKRTVMTHVPSMKKRGGNATNQPTAERVAQVQAEELARFTESMNRGEEPCSTWWGNPSLNWDIELEDRCNGPMGFAWTR